MPNFNQKYVVDVTVHIDFPALSDLVAVLTSADQAKIDVITAAVKANRDKIQAAADSISPKP